MTAAENSVPHSGYGVIMFIPDFLTTLSITNAENPNLFPFPFKLHLIFCIVAFVFFIFRFAFDKKPYQAILAVAIPFSMTLWISDNRFWFYTVGIIEFLFIIAAVTANIVYKIRHPQPKEEKAAAEISEKNRNEAE